MGAGRRRRNGRGGSGGGRSPAGTGSSVPGGSAPTAAGSRGAAAGTPARPRRRSAARRAAPAIAAALVALAAGGWAIRSGASREAAVPLAPGGPATTAGRAVQTLAVTVHRAFPHDTAAYTQGLLWSDGRLYESTGQYGRSDLRRIDPATGAVEQRTAIEPAYFGEGLARVDDTLIMLTWKAQRAFVFGLDRFDRQRTFRYRGDGWGLCHDGRRLVMSNGSDRLTFRDRRTFEPTGGVAVTLAGAPLTQINELECVDGAVYANVYQQDVIVRIDPADGRVTHRIDASGLLPPAEARRADVLNGIAFDPGAGTFYITGKLWPTMFEVTFD